MGTETDARQRRKSLVEASMRHKSVTLLLVIVIAGELGIVVDRNDCRDDFVITCRCLGKIVIDLPLDCVQIVCRGDLQHLAGL